MSNSMFFNIKIWIKNLYSALKYNSHKDILDVRQQLQKKDLELKEWQFVFLIRLYYAEHSTLAQHYKDELQYFAEGMNFSVFPYKHKKLLDTVVENGFDMERRLPFVLHKNKRLYFPPSWNQELVVHTYHYLIECECILGGGYTEKAPHQYQTENFKIEAGDILLDIGCAEALVSLDAIDTVSKVYIFESDPNWIPVLEATFAPYKEKVSIINKLVSSQDTATSITLETALAKEKGKSIFIKMDIEGYETEVISASRNFLTSDRKFKLACCTYHKAGDAEMLKGLFDKLQFHSEFSDGYMLFPMDEQQVPPFFRHGLIRAKNFK